MPNDTTQNAKAWVGFDLGGTKMLAAVFDRKLSVTGRCKRNTKAFLGPATGLERIVRTIREALADAQCDAGDVGAIGIGCPGLVDPDNGILLDPANLGWRDLPVRKPLEKEFGCPVVVANDVDAGVYGEYAEGAARKARCALGVFPGTGIGGGCVYEGRILTGSGRSCLELGHMQVVPGGARCGCGQRGCLETVASRLAISAEAVKAAFRGQAPHLVERCGMDLSEVRSGDLAAAIAAGDREIERIVRDAAAWLGLGLANVVNLLAPDVVVLGGGLVEAMPKLYLQQVESTARKRVMSSLAHAFKVVVSALGDNAVVVGAAAWARDRTGGTA